MPGLNLITGGPASGKTEHLLAIAAARYHADTFAQTLVLVPTARHADQFRQRLVARVGVAVGLEVTTARLFAARLTAGAPVASSDVASELLAGLIRQQAAGPGPARRFAPLAHTSGLHTMVRAALSELCAASIDPQLLADRVEGLGLPDLPALAQLYDAYLEALQERGWHPPEARARLAAQAIEGHPLPPLVLVDGMQFLDPGEVELVATLASRADVWLALDPQSGERAAWTLAALLAAVPGARIDALPERAVEQHFEAYSTADHEAQLREIARSIKQRLVDDPTLRPSDVAVTMRQIAPHLAAARRVFSEFDLPLDPAAGERLAERPLGVWLLRLLRLPAHDWRLLDVLDTLGGGWFDGARAGFQSGDLERLRRLGRRHQLWSGLDALRRLPEAARVEAEDDAGTSLTLARAAEAWLRTLERLASFLDPETERTPGEHAALLDAALFGPEGLVGDGASDAPAFAAEVTALRRDLDAFRAVDEALGASALRFAAFVDLLEHRLQRASTLIREAGGVLLAPMHTLHGLRFRHVYVAGLVEGEFPAARHDSGLLSPAIRTALAEVRVGLPPASRASEDELWRGAVSRAETTSLWCPRFDGSGRRAAPSYYFARSGRESVIHLPLAAPPETAGSMRELALSLTRRWPADTRRPKAHPAWELVIRAAAPIEQRRRSFATAGRFEGRVLGIDTARLVRTDVEWSASRFESYRTCPFQFFSHYGLLLDELDEERSEADAATQGTVIHAILEDALAPLVARGAPLDAAGLVEALGRLRSSGRDLWDRAPLDYAFGRAALWRHQGELTLTRLERLLRREAGRHEQAGLRAVAGSELHLSGRLPGVEPPLLVQARIDRVDRGEDGIEVVDYKSGQPISRSEIDAGRRLQLQLYSLVAGHYFGADHLVARYAYLRPPRAEWLLDDTLEGDHHALEEAVNIAVHIREDVAAGRFQVAPLVPECPSYCAARTVCRVNHFSRAKTWS